MNLSNLFTRFVRPDGGLARPSHYDPEFHAVCYCAEYSWPHAINTGKCHCNEGEDLCGNCGNPSDTKMMDFGIGHYEFWGAPGNDVNWQEVSTCCEASMVANRVESRKKGWFS